MADDEFPFVNLVERANLISEKLTWSAMQGTGKIWLLYLFTHNFWLEMSTLLPALFVWYTNKSMELQSVEAS